MHALCPSAKDMTSGEISSKTSSWVEPPPRQELYSKSRVLLSFVSLMSPGIGMVVASFSSSASDRLGLILHSTRMFPRICCSCSCVCLLACLSSRNFCLHNSTRSSLLVTSSLSEAASAASSALSDLAAIISFSDDAHLSWTSWSFTWSSASLLRASLAAFLASSLSALAFLTFSSPNLCSTRSLDSSVFTSRFSLSQSFTLSPSSLLMRSR
mmetsp:Transcript_6602/g.23754  ORF Transcript_6602/g.23754 Transcript_6602/m.23754 type:complete len:212 (+) Transcript_6602:407-1042(+)